MRCDDSVLILGRALHAPWNEGTRVINRNFAIAASSLRQVRLVSITNGAFRPRALNEMREIAPVEHVYTRSGYDLIGVYRGLPGLLAHLHRTNGYRHVAVAHLFAGMPLS